VREKFAVTALAVASLYVPGGAALAAAPAAPAAATADEIAQIRSQLQGLLQRVDRLEQENTTLKTENEELKATSEYLQAETRGLRKDSANTSTAVGNLRGGEWASRVALTGDFRYRYEYIGDKTENLAGVQTTADRYRERIRARFNVVARPTDTINMGFSLSTAEGGDPRSGNQSLTGVFNRKPVELDLAYFDWTFATWGHLIGGKMRQPFVKGGQSLFWDNDVNPEGLALTFQRGIFFGSAYNFWLNEISGAENTKTSDSMMAGAQLGLRMPLGASTLTLAAHYYELSASQLRVPAPIFAGNANGNTTVTIGGQPALAFNYEVIEALAQLNMNLGNLPLQIWVTGLQNNDPDDLNTAYAAGFLLGNAQNYRTWQFGVNYHLIEKDSLYAQLMDSDWAGGVSDSNGYTFLASYAPLRNWTLNATYFLNQRNIDVANQFGAKEVDYDRLQLDFNVRF
jgi:hypothetical protein